MSEESSAFYAATLAVVHQLEAARDVVVLIRMLDNPVEESPTATVRAAAAGALGRIGDHRAAQGLSRLLDDGSPRVRMTAAYALGRAGNADSCLKLVELLDDAYALVRDAAIESPGLLGCRGATAQVRPALDSDLPWTRLHAATALFRLGEPPTDREVRDLIRRERLLAPVRQWKWRRLYKSIVRELSAVEVE